MVIVSLDMQQAYVREYYEVEEKSQLLKFSFIPGLIILIIGILSLQFINFSISEYFIGEYSKLIDFYIISGIAFLFCINLLSHSLRMQGRGWAFSATQVIPKLGLLFFLGFVVLFFNKYNYKDLIATNVFALLVSVICFIFVLKDEIKKAYLAKYNKVVIKRMLLFSLPLLTGSLAYWALVSLDRLILNHFTNFKEVSIYVVATNLAAGIGVFVTVFSNLWHPIVYRWVNEGVDLKKIILINDLMVLAVCFLWTCVGVFSWIVIYFFPNQYDGVQYIVVACVAMPLLYMLSETTNIGIGISRRTGFAMLTSVVALAINIIVNYISVPIYGAKGAALASMTAFTFFLILRTEFSIYLWKSLPRLRMYVFILIYYLLTILTVFEFFPNIIFSSIVWVLALFVIYLTYFSRFLWLIKVLKFRGLKC